MIDIHAHVLPGLDDGSKDMYDTMAMLTMAAESGITDMIATPHCNIQGTFDNYYNNRYIQTFREVEKAIQEMELPIRLYPGAEVFVTVDLLDLIARGKVLTLNGGHYMLLEFDFYESLDFANDMLEKISQMGIRPVIAHPERYFFVQKRPRTVYEWYEKGYVLQCNKGSFTGRFGERCGVLAYEMLEHNLVSVIASDAHSSTRRTPVMLDTYEELLDGFDLEYLDILFEENPRRILHDEPVIKLP